VEEDMFDALAGISGTLSALQSQLSQLKSQLSPRDRHLPPVEEDMFAKRAVEKDISQLKSQVLPRGGSARGGEGGGDRGGSERGGGGGVQGEGRGIRSHSSKPLEAEVDRPLPPVEEDMFTKRAVEEDKLLEAEAQAMWEHAQEMRRRQEAAATRLEEISLKFQRVEQASG
jgi:hypothetical protein